jgi:hypothetical protein
MFEWGTWWQKYNKMNLKGIFIFKYPSKSLDKVV